MTSIRCLIGRILLLAILCAGLLTLAACQPEKHEAELLGIWRIKYTYMMFSEDGSWSVAWVVGDVKSTPFDWGTFTFVGELLTFFTDEVAKCKGMTSTYEVAFLEEGEALFSVVQDPCPNRQNDLNGGPWSRHSP